MRSGVHMGQMTRWRNLICAAALMLAAPLVCAGSNSDGWIEQGWQLVEQQPEAAILQWEQGLARLDEKRLLGSLGLFSHLEYALDQLYKAGPDSRALIVHDREHPDMYQVVVAQAINPDMKQRQIEMAGLKQRLGMQGKLYAIRAAKLRPANTPPTPSPEQADTPAQQTSNDTTPSSPVSAEWVDQGWRSLDRNRYADALYYWQKGLNRLDPMQPVCVAGAFSQLGYAIERAEAIGRQRGAFIIRPDYIGQGYFTVLVADTERYRPTRLKAETGIREGFYIAASGRFQSGNFSGNPYTDVALHTPVNHTALHLHPATYSPTPAPDAFTINRFEVSGNKLLPTDLILISLRDYYVGEHSTTDIDHIRRTVIDLYEMSGYSHVRIGLPHKLESDTVEINIDEARIVH